MELGGYVKNMTHLWAHTMKRAVGPGARIPLQDIYDQYGKKHNLEPNKDFVKWVRNVKLRDRDKWGIFSIDDKPFEDVISDADKSEKVNEDANPVTVVVDKSRGENVAPPVVKDMEVADIVALSVRKSREAIPLIHDIQLLKYAENEASQLAGKDSLCIILRKRIQELSISSRR